MLMNTAVTHTKGQRVTKGKKHSTRERRWVILAEDGRHVSIGRHSDPSPEELAQSEANLAAQGLAGWLVIMEGGYYQRGKPSLMMVRSLCNPQRPFAEAIAAFQAAREATLDGLK
jgi:hypothetical protein